MMKKIGFIFFVVIFFMCFMAPFVFADSLLNIEDVADNFGKTSSISFLNDNIDGNISALVDSSNNKFNVINGNDILYSFDYNNEFISYVNNVSSITQDDDLNLFSFFVFSNLIEAVLNTSGYTNMTISSDMDDSVLNYDTYGIEYSYSHYDFDGYSGDYITGFKISLDKSKIDRLISDYGVQKSDSEIDYSSLIPSLNHGDVTDNTVILYPLVSNFDFSVDTESVPYCYIYRSTSEDGEYELINDIPVICNGSFAVIDDNLASNTMYYYKAKVVGGSTYSDSLSVSTLNKNIIEEIVNPKTGQSYIVVVIGLIGVSIFLVNHFYKRYSTS